MKKICFLLCMFSAMFAFNACSDDDDDPKAVVPVTEVVVPAQVEADGNLIITGKGFSKDCKILLRNATQSVELPQNEPLNGSVSCKVPATLAPGDYSVVLVQGGEWILGNVTILGSKRIDKITEVSKKGKIKNYYYTYDAQERISSIEKKNEESPIERTDFKWEERKLTVSIFPYYSDKNVYDDLASMAFEYTLGDDGYVTNSKMFVNYDGQALELEESHSWTVSEGYLKAYGTYTYTYDGKHIKTYTFTDEGYSSVSNFAYSGQVNKITADLTGEVLFQNEIEYEEQYYARIAGICGVVPDLLPSSITDEAYPDEPKEITYKADEMGYISEFTTNDGKTFKITYK